MFFELLLPFSNIVLFAYKDDIFYRKFQFLSKEIKFNRTFKNFEDLSAFIKRYTNKKGVNFNLEFPQTLNEKLIWLMLNDLQAANNIIKDKRKLKNYISKNIGEEYFLPAYKGGDTQDCSVRNKYSKFVSEYYNDYLPYKLQEYSVLCFNGTPQYVFADKLINGQNYRDVYDLNWELQKFTFEYKMSGTITPPPANMYRMLEWCKKLSKGIYFIVITLSTINEKLYIRDISISPEELISVYTPLAYDLKLGRLLSIPAGQNSEVNEKICA